MNKYHNRKIHRNGEKFDSQREYKETVVEDAKGLRTKDYIIKRKLMLYVHNIRVREV